MSASQVSRGIALGAVSALLFGVTTPFLKVATKDAGTLASAALLYLGAAGGAGAILAVRRGARGVGLLRGRALVRLIGVALAGSVCAPFLLIAGLKRVDAATGSLLLSLEAPFTLVLARLFLREYLGPRVWLAAALILAGGLVLGAGWPGGAGTLAGVGLVVLATLAWAIDNLLSRTLADVDPVTVVAHKGALGAALSVLAAAVAGQRMPAPSSVALLLAVGALGYGVSLQLYLRAQVLVGAARTASVFAAAPFVGAIAALLFGAPAPGWQFVVAALLMIAGVALHLSERHSHRHTHEALVHAHVHQHDDGHHTHAHDGMPDGPHSHPHQHEPLTHDHEHSEDLHHRHPH